MLRTSLICFALVASLVSNSYGQAFSSFDNSDEGWLVAGDGASAVPSFSPSDGNPGGHIFIDDGATGGVFYWDAPQQFLGDKSNTTNLVFDLATSQTNAQFDDEDILIEGGGLTIAFDTESNPGVDFTSYNIALDDSAPWRLDNLNGQLATNAQIQQVLSDVTRLQIRGEFIIGFETGRLDNVGLLLQEPPTNVLSQTFNNELDFLRSTFSFESFESLADRPLSNDPIVSPLFTISPVLSPAEIRSTPTGGHFATDGLRYISAGSNTLSTELVFELASPATGFGLSVTDFGESGPGDLTFQTDTGDLADELVVASNPQSNGSLIFFGFTQEIEFSTVTVRATTVPDGIGIDGVHILPAVILGDVNMNGVVDFSDIPAFIAALQSGEFKAEADCNQDGVVNFADIPAFIDILINQ